MEYTKLEKCLLPTGWRSDAVLEWKQPQEAWRILEAKWFTVKRIVISMLVAFVSGLALLRVIVWLIKLPMPILVQLLLCSCVAVLGITIAVLLWWFSPIIMKISNTGITRLVWNDRKTWNFSRLQNYSFEHLESKSGIFTILVLRSKRGKFSRIALSDSVDLNELARILNEHGIFKVENLAETVLEK